MDTIALIVAAAAIFGLLGSWVSRRVQERFVKVQLRYRLNGTEVKRESITLHDWRALKKSKQQDLARLVATLNLTLDTSQKVEIGRLSGPGGGRRHKLSIPVLEHEDGIQKPGWLVLQAHW